MEPFDELTTRRDRLAAVVDAGVDPYPSTSRRTHSLARALAEFETVAKEETIIIVAGRVLAIRGHGGSTFLTLSDGTDRLQAYIKKDQVGHEAYAFLERLDVADFVEVTGKLFLTHRGERSIMATEPLRFLTK